MEKQRTIAQEVSLEGVGLHTGNMSRIIFKPAPVNSGIRFVRTDMAGKPAIAAKYTQVLGGLRGTTIGVGQAQVHTIEHVMAALSIYGIDNLDIDINNNEPPVMDGSARAFTDVLVSTGIREQDAARNCLTLKAPVSYESGITKLAAYPAESFSIECTIGYDHPLLREQHATFVLTPEVFRKEIASARTFCFDYEIEALKSNGLAKGGDFSNAIVVGLAGIHNPEKLRYPDEFVRHKILDLIGDLYLLGMPLKARIVAVKCGHNHNVNFVKELIKQKSM
jgi:UDP-3-O-acyl N-acetylglucosamine deacetylase